MGKVLAITMPRDAGANAGRGVETGPAVEVASEEGLGWWGRQKKEIGEDWKVFKDFLKESHGKFSPEFEAWLGSDEYKEANRQAFALKIDGKWNRRAIKNRLAVLGIFSLGVISCGALTLIGSHLSLDSGDGSPDSGGSPDEFFCAGVLGAAAIIEDGMDTSDFAVVEVGALNRALERGDQVDLQAQLGCFMPGTVIVDIDQVVDDTGESMELISLISPYDVGGPDNPQHNYLIVTSGEVYTDGDVEYTSVTALDLSRSVLDVEDGGLVSNIPEVVFNLATGEVEVIGTSKLHVHRSAGGELQFTFEVDGESIILSADQIGEISGLAELIPPGAMERKEVIRDSDESSPSNPPIYEGEIDDDGPKNDLLESDPYLKMKTDAGYHMAIKMMLRHMGVAIDLPWDMSTGEWEQILKDLAETHKIDVMQPWNGSETKPIILNMAVRTNVDDSTTFLWQVHPETLSPENWPAIAPSQELLMSGKYQVISGEVNVPVGYEVQWRYSDIDDIGSDAYSLYGYMVDEDGNAVAWFNTDKAHLDSESGEIVNAWYWVDEDGVPQQEGQVVMGEDGLVVINDAGEVILELGN